MSIEWTLASLQEIGGATARAFLLRGVKLQEKRRSSVEPFDDIERS